MHRVQSQDAWPAAQEIGGAAPAEGAKQLAQESDLFCHQIFHYFWKGLIKDVKKI